MEKQIIEKSEINKLVEIYFGCIDTQLYFIQALEEFEKGGGYGQEYVCCTFPSDYETWEEGYFGDWGVKISINYPAYKEDVIAIISNEEFLKYLIDESIKFINKFPNRKKEVNEYLEQIKIRLGIN